MIREGKKKRELNLEREHLKHEYMYQGFYARRSCVKSEPPEIVIPRFPSLSRVISIGGKNYDHNSYIRRWIVKLMDRLMLLLIFVLQRSPRNMLEQ